MLRRLRDDPSFTSLLEEVGFEEGLVVVDVSGKPVRWNGIAERLLGVEDLTAGADWLQRPRVFADDERQLAQDARPLARALRGDEVTGVELVVRLPGKPPALIVVSTRSLRDGEGSIVGAIAIFREITEQRRLERALRQSERLYRTLAQHLPTTVVLLFDRSLRFILAAGQGIAGSGLTPAEIEGKSVLEVGTPALLDKYRAALEGQSGEGEVRRWGRLYRVQLTPVRDETGAVFAGLALSTDITEERAASERLREAEEQFRLTIEQAPIGMAVVSLDGRWLLVNGALCHIVGYSREELMGLTFQDITHPDDLEKDLWLVEQLVRGDIPRYELGKRYRRKDGRFVETMLHASLVRGENGEPRHFIAQIQDMTERRQLEARLLLADRMTSIGTLAAGVAHEINNPLTYVSANLELLARQLRELADGPQGGRFHDLLGMVGEARDGAERVTKIVRGLRTFSRSDEEQRSRLKLPSVLEAAIHLSMNEIRHRAKLERVFGPTPLVLADEARLAQVFINLLVNAAHAIPEGHADRNAIRVTTSTDVDGRAVVEIQDTGGGMTPDVRARIFDPFFTTKPIGMGTGLGLSICHSIVEAHGGEIAVESAVGQGSVFRIVLPGASPVPDVEGAPPAPRAVPPPGVPARVLVVDDEPLVGRSIRRVLGHHHVHVLTNGADALEHLLSGARYDVILCDLMMPKMTGMELHAKLLERAPELAARMVFITGGAFTPAAHEFLDRVANPRLEKPLDVGALGAMVDSCRR